MLLRLTSPKEPAGGSAKAHVLKKVLGIQDFARGSPTRSGRCWPSELATPLSSSMVNQFPDETEVMPPTCQPPTIWLSTPLALPNVRLPWLAGWRHYFCFIRKLVHHTR